MEYVDCVVLGNKGIGKHSLIGGFQDSTVSLEDELSLSLTIDKKKVDFVVKIVDETVDNKLRRLMYLKADVIILGYSTIDLPSYHAVREKWITELHSQAPNVPVLLMGTKLDRVPEDLIEKVKVKGEKTAKELGCIGFQETSSVSSVNTQLFERAVQSGLMKKRLQRTMNESDPKKKKYPFYNFSAKATAALPEQLDADDANVARVAKISANTTDYAYKWRGELVTLLMEDLLDGRIDYNYSDAERDMTESFNLEFAVEAAGQITKKLLIFFHFLPIVNTCMEQHNLQFWFEVEDFKYNKEVRDMKRSAKLKRLKRDAVRIFQDYLPSGSSKEINVDSEVRNDITLKLNNVTNNRIFDLAQLHVLTQLASVFKEQYVLSHTVKALLHTLKSLRDILPDVVVDGEAETVPLPTTEGLSRMMAVSVHVMTLMEFLHSSNAPEKRPAKPQFLKFEDEDRIVKMGVKYLLLFAALKTHMDREKSQENLMFWLDAEDFRSLDFGAPREDDATEHDKVIRRQLAVRATHLVRRYVDDDAEMLVNLPGHITKQIKINLAELQEAAKAPPSKRMDEIVAKSQTMFDSAQREILVLMKRDSWRRFHTSSEAQNIRRLLDKVCVPEEYEDPERLRMETRLHNRFDLTSDEKVVRGFTCALERKMLLHGQLFITKRHLCFFSNVFGLKTKMCYNFAEILEISNAEPEALSRKKAQIGDNSSVIVKTTDHQVHVFTQIVPSHAQLMYVFRKARQRLEKGHDDAPTAIGNAGGDSSDEDDDNLRELSEKDWEMFKEGAEILEFKTGAEVLAQGAPAGFLYQVARGTVNIEKITSSGERITLRSCTQGEIIGEISFVEGGNVSAAVVAASDDVVMYAMSRTFVENALVNNPGLPGRFYRFLATLLAERLRTKRVTSEEKNHDVSAGLTPKQFLVMFGLPEDTAILSQWSCAIKGKLMMYGSLFLVPSALCFYSKVLGSVKKRVIPLSEVSHVASLKHTLVVTHRSVDKTTEFLNLDMCEQARDGIQAQLVEFRKLDTVHQASLPVEDEIDWSMFLGGAELKRYNKDDAILKQGSPSRYVYQVAAGEARAEKENDDGTVEVFRKIQVGEMFGEMSFLQDHPPSASIVSTMDNTLVYNIDKKFVDSLLDLNPELPGRFYKFLATFLASRLRN
eukprot:c9435_g1_i1.p1 GENE.c9435_g1_i1~~c9435_g1_i1.p1  ORF type:complete len:1156 (-),score=387.18 c9435_g1_i1:226-3693(-)